MLLLFCIALSVSELLLLLLLVLLLLSLSALVLLDVAAIADDDAVADFGVNDVAVKIRCIVAEAASDAEISTVRLLLAFLLESTATCCRSIIASLFMLRCCNFVALDVFLISRCCFVGGDLRRALLVAVGCCCWPGLGLVDESDVSESLSEHAEQHDELETSSLATAGLVFAVECVAGTLWFAFPLALCWLLPWITMLLRWGCDGFTAFAVANDETDVPEMANFMRSPPVSDLRKG